MLSVEKLSFTYRQAEAEALKDVDLSVSRTELVAIMGPNGAGKTTLCLACNGLIPQVVPGSMRGQVVLDGMDTRSTPVPRLATKVGMVLQNPEAQFFGESVEEEVAFGPENLCLSIEEIEQRITSALQTVRMKEHRDRFPFHLSGGQKQRLAIATALSMYPEMLVMDEPTSELDPQGKTEVLSAIRELKDEHGKTIILVSHETDEVIKVADRVVLLDDEGRVQADGEPARVLTAEQTQHLRIPEPQLFSLWRSFTSHSTEPPPVTVADAAKRLQSSFHRMSVPPKPGVVTTGDPIIRVQELSHVYPNGTEALRDIDLEIHRGEFVALMGQNGSGKTTLSRHLNGLLRPTRGRVEVNGIDTRTATIAELACTVGYAFQNPDHQLFAQTVADELAFGLRNIGVSETEIKNHTSAALETVNLQTSLEEYPFFLGKGERQLLALASVLVMDPQILVIDEPTTGQDWRGAEALMHAIQDLNRKGQTVIFISHDTRLVAEYAQRAIIMSGGQIIADDSPSSVFYDRAVMHEAFLKPPPIVELAQTLSPEAAELGLTSVEELRACLVGKAVG